MTGSLWTYVAIGLADQAHAPTWACATGLRGRLEREHDIAACMRDKDSRSRVATDLLCHNRVWGWDLVAWVAIEVSLSRQSPIGPVSQPWTVL